MDARKEEQIRREAYALARKLQERGHQDDAQDLRQLTTDWHGVVTASSDDEQEDLLADWQEEAQQDDLASLVSWYAEYLATCPDCPRHAEGWAR